MWYFSWILGLLLACALGVVSLLWLEAQEAWAREHITLDPLTQLFDRKEMRSRLREKIENSKRNESPFALIFISLSAFRRKNKLAYNEMDTILRSVADTFRRDIRTGLDIASRFDEEGFLIALPGTNFSAADDLARQIRRNITDNVKTPENRPVQVETGIAEYTVHQGKFEHEDETMMSEVDELIQVCRKTPDS